MRIFLISGLAVFGIFGSEITCPWLDSLPAHVIALKQDSTQAALPDCKPEVASSTTFRFYFTFDSIRVDSLMEWARNVDWVKSMPHPSITFFRFITDDYTDRPLQQALFSFNLVLVDGRWRFRVMLNDSKSTVWKEKIIRPIKARAPYSVECRLTLAADSTAERITFRFNGKPAWEEDLRPLDFRIKRQMLRFGVPEMKYHARGEIYISQITCDTAWPGDVPRKPVISGKGSCYNGQDVSLVSPAYRPFLAATRLTASRYQIHFKDNGWDLPLYDTGPDSAAKDSVRLPLALDPARDYVWRIRHLNDQGNFSAWSGPAPLPFRGDTADDERPSIARIAFREPGSQRETALLYPGKWVDLVMTLSDPAGSADVSYGMFFINNREYTLATPLNKGGLFLPSANYYFNLSFDPDKIFEKSIPGTYAFTRLTDRPGLYADASRKVFVRDTANNTVRFRMRLLPDAAPGPWCVRGFLKNSREKTSAFYYDTIRVAPAPETAGRDRITAVLVTAVMAVGALLSIFFVRRRNAGPRPPALPTREQALFNEFAAFVRANLKSELTSGEIEARMKMSYSSVYRIVKLCAKTSVENFILNERMEKAAQLLKETRLNITEVMLESGFNNSAYFSRSFKKHTGLAPTDYRKKAWGEA